MENALEHAVSILDMLLTMLRMEKVRLGVLLSGPLLLRQGASRCTRFFD